MKRILAVLITAARELKESLLDAWDARPPQTGMLGNNRLGQVQDVAGTA